ncbi:uncharacterized protein LOC111870811 isoform X2 [Cryptotermes secundus]|uniref:uncharacterized protein LOC111870811 isoform X2 n=1 Tax=Cryptotermes secundus TaxID=105785 RepID=UPI000CD7DCAF|nr:uncharacterized protein LOC111870811 isoform X2 [Cryptotermes secundus]
MYFGYFSLRLITRLTALYGMAVSIVVMTILTMELKDEEKGRGKIFIFLGIDIDEFDINHNERDSNAVVNTDNYKYTSSRLKPLYPFVLICYIYSCVEIVANALLVWGTLVEKLWCAVPWFICKTINLSIQFIGFIHYILMEDKPENQVLATALFNFVVTLIFWCTVYQTVQRWIRQDSHDTSYTRIVAEADNLHKFDPSQLTHVNCDIPP